MGRKVKCKICRAEGNSNTFYKVTNDKGVNSYFCNKEEYDLREKEKKDRYELLKYIAEEILQYEDGQIVPPSMVKKIEKLHEFYTYEIIHESFRMNKDDIQYWIKVKGFTSEFGMASYIMKIIEGSINDIYKQWKYKQQQSVIQESHLVDVQILNDTKESKKINKNNDNGILSFLNEEDI